MVLHFYRMYVAYYMQQLFLTNLYPTWNFSQLEFAFGHAFNLPDFSNLSGVNNGNGNTCFTCTGCTSATVSVTFQIIRNRVVDYVTDVAYVNTAGSHICGNQKLQRTLTETQHYFVTLLLTQITVKCISIIAFFNQLFSYILRIHFGLCKYQTKNLRLKIDDTF